MKEGQASGSGSLATSLLANIVAQTEPDGLKSQAGCLLLGRFISLLPSEDLGAFAFTDVRWVNIDNK